MAKPKMWHHSGGGDIWEGKKWIGRLDPNNAIHVVALHNSWVCQMNQIEAQQAVGYPPDLIAK